MEESLVSTLEQIGRYRDRFSGWGLVVGFLSVVTAIWMRAPALDVNLPLVGGAQVGMNVGYVMMAGMLILALALAWLIGPLLNSGDSVPISSCRYFPMMR